ncbi:MAG: hypothetical protein C0392_14265 [Syntrophus sp. (in: bacteria)]|nr:hypothetical protein [Syntrophus sp. (in: bacteria)]
MFSKLDIAMDDWTPDRIKTLRTAMKLTQKKFSECIGVTDIYVNYLEKGVRKPSKTLCILFDCMARTEKENENGKEVELYGKGTQKHTPRKGSL